MKPVVGIVMGSASDWDTMKSAAKVLEEFGIAYEAIEGVYARASKLKLLWLRGVQMHIGWMGGAASSKVASMARPLASCTVSRRARGRTLALMTMRLSPRRNDALPVSGNWSQATPTPSGI